MFAQNVTQFFRAQKKIVLVSECATQREFVLLDSLAVKNGGKQNQNDNISLKLPALLVKLIELSIKIITQLSTSIVSCYW